MSISAYEKVKLARSIERPKPKQFIEELIKDPIFFHGDRCGGEDKAVMGGIGYFNSLPVTFIAINKGKNTEKSLEFNFGMAKPEGYRKPLRLMKQAEKFGRPVITFIDTPGAYPGIDAEKNGQAMAIAQIIQESGFLNVPIISVITGEGGSGGALALAVSDTLIMLENSVYSILSPEGFCSILFKNMDMIEKATETMKLTAQDLKKAGVCDEIIDEQEDYSFKNFEKTFADLKRAINRNMSKHLASSDLVERRFEKFRSYGV